MHMRMLPVSWSLDVRRTGRQCFLKALLLLAFIVAECGRSRKEICER